MNHSHYELVEKAILLLSQAPSPQHSVEQLAQQLNVSTTHLQRLFKQWAGLSPKQFIQALSRNHTLEAIEHSKSILDASIEAGFSGPGRLHDFTVKLVAATPGEIKSKGAGMALNWGVGQTPFGQAFCAQTSRGVCALDFLNDELPAQLALSALEQAWPNATLTQNNNQTQITLDQMFKTDQAQTFSLWVRASPFQIRVWQALINLPPGTLTTYGDLAAQCGHAGAARAVGTAVGSNSIAWLIPCHRVIRQTGQFGQYKWQSARKQAIHAWETGKLTL